MKLIAHLQRVETRLLELEGEDYVETRDRLIASVPDGYTLLRISRAA
ncbi:hypothetical protein ACH9EU_05470 [Kocuria sp. M1R5S2]